MKKILLTFVTLFVLISCSKDDAQTSTTTETPATPTTTSVTQSIILPKTITKDGKTYNYVYEGKKIKSYATADKSEEYEYTYNGDFISKFSRIQKTDKQGYEYNFTYETSNFQGLNSIKYWFYTNTFSSIFTAVFNNNTISLDIINKNNTSGMLTPYDDNLLSPPFYTFDNNLQIIKQVTQRKNMAQFSQSPNEVVIITTNYEYDSNNAHKNPYANIMGINKLLFYDIIASAKHNIRNVSTTYSSLTNSFSPVTENVYYNYEYNEAGYPTKITATPNGGNSKVTTITY
jgi:hypothetical protein